MKREPIHVLLVAIVIFLLLAGCGSSSNQTTGQTGVGATATVESKPQLPATVKGSDGVPVTIKDVSRIVSLGGDLSEIIWRLGLAKNIVAADITTTYPTELSKVPRVGTSHTPTAEGILSFQPTVVFTTADVTQADYIKQVQAAQVPVLAIKDDFTLESAVAKINTLAQGLGLPGKGQLLARQVQKEITAAQTLAKRATDKPKVLFLYVRGTQTQMIGGSETDADVMITAAGAENRGATIGIKGYKPITPEALATADPDVLLLLEGGLQSVGGIEGLLKIPGVAQTPAGQQKKVLSFDDLYLLGMTPRTGQALHDLVLKLHPDLA